jgi:YVTN family beta-propeller protein
MFYLFGRIGLAMRLVLLGVSLVAQETQSPLPLSAKILLPGVHGRIGHLAADYYNARLFVAASGNDTVEVVDVRTNLPLATIHEVTEPHSVAYLKTTNQLLVTNGGDGSLRTFEGASLKPLTTLHLGRDPDAIRVDSAHNRVFVGYGDGTIAVLDFTGKRVADIALKSHPEAFQIATHEPRLFVNLPDSQIVAVVDTNSFKVIAEWPIKEGRGNYTLALNEDKRRVFVACRQPARLLAFDMDSGHLVAQLPTVGDADDLFYDVIHSRIYVVGGTGQVAVYAQPRADHYVQIDSVGTRAEARTGLFVPEWNRFFVALRDFAANPAEIRVYNPN